MRAVVLCHTPELGLVVLRALRANGLAIHVACDAGITGFLACSRCCDDLLFSGDLAGRKWELADAVNGLHKAVGVDIVLACNVEGMRLLHEIGEALIPPIFPMPPLDALDVLDDKRTLHRLAIRMGIPVPRTLEFHSARAIDTDVVSRELAYPLAVKPARGWSGIGFRKIESAEELAQLAADPSYRFSDVIVQEYVEGEDVGAGLFVRHGRVEAIATFKCGPRDAAEFVPIPGLAEIAERIVNATRCEGVINFDARLTPKGEIRLLECNPRPFMRTRAARFCGLDFMRLGLPGYRHAAVTASRRYRPLGDVATLDGLRQLLTGEWPVRVLARTAAEFLTDPVPSLLGRVRRRAGLAFHLQVLSAPGSSPSAPAHSASGEA